LHAESVVAKTDSQSLVGLQNLHGVRSYGPLRLGVQWKVVFLMIAGANFLYLTVFKKAWAADGLDSRLADKAMAVSSIVAWLAVLYAGRMLPFLGNAF